MCDSYTKFTTINAYKMKSQNTFGMEALQHTEKKEIESERERKEKKDKSIR